MKYKIEKNTVQETLIIPLYSRKLCSELYPNLYRDEMAVHLIDQIDYDFSQVEKKSHGLMQRFGSLEVAMRQNDLAWEVQNYLADHPNAAVVNLGCGLDSTGRACDRWTNPRTIILCASCIWQTATAYPLRTSQPETTMSPRWIRSGSFSMRSQNFRHLKLYATKVFI